MDRIPERVDSTFRFVLLAARRAEQLMRGARPKVEQASSKPSRVALREVSDDLVEWDYGPAPEPVFEEMAEEEIVEETTGE
jgi:DNA-directed RNA polymerase subunit omega